MQNQFLSPESSAQTTPYVVPLAIPETAETAKTTIAPQAVTDMLTTTQRTTRRRKFRIWVVFAAVEAACLLPMFLGLLSSTAHNGIFTANFYLLFLIPFAFSAMLITLFMPVKLDVEALMKLGGKRAIPALLDAVTLNPTTRYRKSILNALTVLLPQLQASDASLLTPWHRRLFTTWLTHAFNPAFFRGVGPEFIVALLKAYKQVGDAKAIPLVERLANSDPRNENQRKIQQAAQDCLPLLQAHVSGVDVTQTLLRASALDTNTPDTLLRAATTNAPTPDTELLRAADPNDLPPSA